MKIGKKYGLLLLIPFFASLFCLYRYSRQPIELKFTGTSKEVPVKAMAAFPMLTADSLQVYIPYKVKITNNRFMKIEMGRFCYRDFKKSGNVHALIYTSDGISIRPEDMRLKKQLELDELLHSKLFWAYLKLKYANVIIPFSTRTLYFYKSVKLSNSNLKGEKNDEAIEKSLDHFFRKQIPKLHEKSELAVKDQIMDSLYHAILNLYLPV